jgi:hypothetical protein
MKNANPDISLPNVTAAAPEAKKEWRTMESKARQWKAKAVKANKRRTDMMYGKTLTKQTGEQGKKPHQPMNNNCRVIETWANVIKN